MTCILLIRHGSTDLLGRVLYGRMPGVQLNEEGHRQSALLAAALTQRYRLDAVISSPLERAMETAAPIAAAQERPIQLDVGITEIDFGEWVGKSFQELDELSEWRQFNRSRCMSLPPSGESMMDVQSRAWRTIRNAIAQYPPDSRLAFVTHGDVIRSLLMLFLGMSLDHIHRLEIAPASVSEVQIGDAFPLVRNINRVFY